MNIHEHQAKQILKEFGAPVSKGVVVFSLEEIDAKVKNLKTGEYVLKAQIHAGGRGKGGGVKLVKDITELKDKAKVMLGMNLIKKKSKWNIKMVSRQWI